MNNRSAPGKKPCPHWILETNPIAYKLSTASMVHGESCLLNATAPGKGRGPRHSLTNNNAKSFTLLLFNYNESTHHGNNNNDVFE